MSRKRRRAEGLAAPFASPKRIAWDHVSFLVPANWELAVYKSLKRGVTRVEIEDEYAVRMEAEWIRPKRKPQMENILERYEKRSKKLTIRADHKKEITGLPPGWHATDYRFSEQVVKPGGRGLKIARHGLVTAFYLSPDSAFFAFLLLHFLSEDREPHRELLQLIASEFACHDSADLVPWELFDIAFELPPDFLLENTVFDIGYKLMTFRWQLRRFWLWHFSCADQFLTEGMDIPTWIAGHINDSWAVRGGKFWVDAAGRIYWRRHRRHIIAHRDELSRWCFRYEVRWRHDPEKNQLVFWVFNHRRPEDLDIIPKPLRFE